MLAITLNKQFILKILAAFVLAYILDYYYFLDKKISISFIGIVIKTISSWFTSAVPPDF